MSSVSKRAVAGLTLAVAATGWAALPISSADAAGSTGLVISEVYGGGGNSGATYKSDFIELYNPTASAISVDGKSVQWRSAGSTGNAQVTTLSGSVPAGAHYLVKESTGAGGSTDLPTPDATGTIQMGAAGGTAMLVDGTAAVDPGTGAFAAAAHPTVIDLVGVNSNVFETAAAAAMSNTTSSARAASGADTDNNATDFASGAPTPQNRQPTTPPPDDGERTIAEVQGTGAASPSAGHLVTTRGVVTAAYPTGGFNGFYLQTPGTDTTGASDGLFVYAGDTGSAATVAIGDSVQVTGLVTEFNGLTEITPAAAADVTKLDTSLGKVAPQAIGLPGSEADREAREGELIAPAGPFTVTKSYSTNQYGEIGLAADTVPLMAPTEVADAQDTAAINAATSYNTAHAVTLDDGASWNYLSRDAATGHTGDPLPWLTPAKTVRVGAAATFTGPVVMDFRNNLWKFQPTSQVTGDGSGTATFAQTRTQAPENVGGDLRLATFNVLNYFNTTGAAYVAAGHDCSFFSDRAGNPITVDDCGATGPRGAWDDANLQRQRDKIVTAINGLGTDIVSLEEIENSLVVDGADRDDAIRSLVAALNTAAGSQRWAFAPSPATLPTGEDVIRTGFIYNPATVDPVGESKILVGSAAFDNAREPLAQAFKAHGAPDSDAFAVIVNHFKSKGSGTDDGTGQGNANPDRVAQANALVSFANAFKTERNLTKVFLTGDFNSYSMEDPIQVLEAAGYTNLESTTDPQEKTYSFSGLSGSLDHVFANEAAAPDVTGVDIWGINSGEPLAYEYSRYNYNATNFYAPDQYRASDHDPEVVGIDVPDVGTEPTDVKLNILAVNDFHGRINNNTVKWAGTVEQLREQATTDGLGRSLFVGAGDLVGASEFASAVAEDQPTIDMFNALDLDASAVGNHEFDKGWHDLRDRIIGPDTARNAQWDYLGANVYAKGTQDPVLPEFATYDVDGLTVGVIGAVTEETSSLVSPGGITEIDFGDPVAAVNRVAGELSDGNPANGEADVIMASFHAGATQGVGSNYETEVARGGEFAAMATLDPAVDAIFNGHTHQAYAWDAPVPGEPGKTRPIIQTGNYGDNVGEIRLTIDKATGEVTTYTVRNVARTTTADADLVAKYPRVARVKEIVDAALAHAAEIGNQPVGSITGDITTAFTGGSYVGGKYAGGTRDDRASESTLGDLVANALRDGLPADAGTADLGVVNPGGLRAELLYAGNTTTNPANTDGVVTYAEANGVLPFVNNIWTIRLTGAQLKDVLEQQWQPDSASRPFLALGLSDNVRVTQDPSQPRGSRITSVRINGNPVDPATTYTVSTFSFLGTGGDNFTAFRSGTSKDTGLVDRDLWIQYLKDHPGLTPDFARQQVQSSAVPSQVTAGDQVSFTLNKLDLTSLGSPANTDVSVTLQGAKTVDVGTFPVTNGSANVSFQVPASLSGPYTIATSAAPSQTLVEHAVDVQPLEVREQATVTATATPSTVKVKKGTTTVDVTVAAATADPSGYVGIFSNGSLIKAAELRDGQASIEVGPFTKVGTATLEVRYFGDAFVLPGSTEVDVNIVKNPPRG